MSENRNFAKLNEDGTLEYAPRVLSVDGRVVVSPSDEAYASAGWMKVVRDAPNPPSGKHVSKTTYSVVDGEIHAVYEYEDDARTPRTFSKLKFYSVLVGMGKWTEVKAWLEEAGLWDVFVLAQVVKEDNPQFVQGVGVFKQKFGFTDEQVEAIFSQCLFEYEYGL